MWALDPDTGKSLGTEAGKRSAGVPAGLKKAIGYAGMAGAGGVAGTLGTIGSAMLTANPAAIAVASSEVGCVVVHMNSLRPAFVFK